MFQNARIRYDGCMAPHRVTAWLWLSVWLSGCASREWRAVVEANTSARYSTYAASHVGTARARVAAQRAEALAWEEAVASNQSTAYFSYASAWPKGEHTIEALSRAETLGWSEATADGSVAVLASYIARYPDSKHLGEAKARIEDLVHDEAQKNPTEASLGRYLVQYPEGRYTEAVRTQLEQLIWDATVAADKRAAYERYLDRYPTGMHAEEALQWLDATRVSTLQPALLLLATWHPDQKTVLSQIKSAIDRNFIPDLARDFTLRPIKTVDATQNIQHPHDLFGTEKGVGILVIECTERRGRKFDPSGNATDITAVVKLYAPNTRNPVFVRELSATTPDKIKGIEISALHTSAIDDLVGQLRALDEELARQGREGT